MCWEKKKRPPNGEKYGLLKEKRQAGLKGAFRSILSYSPRGGRRGGGVERSLVQGDVKLAVMENTYQDSGTYDSSIELKDVW